MKPNGNDECLTNKGRDCKWGNGTKPKYVKYIKAN